MALPEDEGSVPRIYMVGLNYPQLWFQGASRVHDTHAYTYSKINKSKEILRI